MARTWWSGEPCCITSRWRSSSWAGSAPPCGPVPASGFSNRTSARRWPALRDFGRRSARLLADAAVLELIRGPAGTPLFAYFNLTDRPRPLGDVPGRNQALLFSSEAGRYLGGRRESQPVGELLPHECVVFGPSYWRVMETR